MLAGLPDEYRPMIMDIESSGAAITADSIKTKLLQDVKDTKAEKNIKGSKLKDDLQPNRKEFKTSVVREVKGDLFTAPQDYSLAHYATADMRMSSGIQITFRQKFKRIDELLAQKKEVGDVAVLNIEEENIKGSKLKDNLQPNRKEFKTSVVREVKDDLFTAPQDYSLAHCVAADMRMGSGIATTFRQKFKRVDELLAQKKKAGDVAVLNIEEQNIFIYYLVTKVVSNGKPYREDLQKSLEKMKKHIFENNVHKLAMPRIGCGLDCLEWSEVLPMIEMTFCDIDIDIVVYDFSQIQFEEKTKKNNVYIRNKNMNLISVQPDTAFIFIGTEDGYVDSTIDSLDSKFHIIHDYKKANKKLGNVIKIEKRDYFYGLIAKKNKGNCISYKDLGSCLHTLQKMLQVDRYVYVGFEAFVDDHDIIATNKVITLIGNYLHSKFEVWVCWPESVILKIPSSYLPKFS